MLLMTNQRLAARFPRMNLPGIDAARTQVVLPEKTVYRGTIRSGIGGQVPRVAMQVKERRRVWNLRRQPPAGEPVAVERQSDRFELQPEIGRRDIQGSSRMVEKSRLRVSDGCRRQQIQTGHGRHQRAANTKGQRTPVRPGTGSVHCRVRLVKRL